MSKKHAYLIMAHNDFYILKRQLQLLDDERNDFYIHIDKKVKNFNIDELRTLVKKSKIYFVPRLDIRWGDFSQIQCELLLMKYASIKRYAYYHLLSWVDLPLKTNDYIHAFFEQNGGIEYVHFCDMKKNTPVKERISMYHFMRLRTAKSKLIRYIGIGLNKFINWIFYQLNLRRKWDDSMELAYGAQWFSVTHDFIKYVISKEDWIKRYFKHTVCGDELFIQTILLNSKFKENLFIKELNSDYLACVRSIDWKRGNPYVWRNEDYEELMQGAHLYARKFSTKIDKEIVDRIYNYLIVEK